MQNSGLGNAVSPLTTLTWTFRLPRLLIGTWRGQPGIAAHMDATGRPYARLMQNGSVAAHTREDI